MNTSENTEKFVKQLSSIQTLIPRKITDSKGKVTKVIAKSVFTRQIVTVVGIKTVATRFLPVSHSGYSNETYVDKVSLLGKTRAEFIGRKLKGIERRSHMALFREMVEKYQQEQKEKELKEKPVEQRNAELASFKPDWRSFFTDNFQKECTIPDGLCIACWNCSLFGGLQAGRGGTFSRIRYFDTYSVEDAAECVQSDDSPEQMAIGNTVSEDLSVERGPESFHRYEYVKAGTRFPFITIIESPTLLDVAGYLTAISLADQHGYGKYSANHGKFETKLLAVSNGYPLFSVLNMLEWMDNDHKLKDSQPDAEHINSSIYNKLLFEQVFGEPITLFGPDIKAVQQKLSDEFKAYVSGFGEQMDKGEKTKATDKTKNK